MTAQKYIAMTVASLTAASAFADDSVPGRQNHLFAGTTQGYIGTEIKAAKEVYKPGEPLNYTLDVFAERNDGTAVPVSGFNVYVRISPLETLANNYHDDVLVRQHQKDYTAAGGSAAPLTMDPEFDMTVPLQALKPGRYAIFTTGTIDGTVLARGAYDIFTVVADAAPQPAPENRFSYFIGKGWDLVAGRYGANWMLPKRKESRLEGITVDRDNVVYVDRVNLSHNFEFKERADCNSCSTIRTSEGYTIGLYAIHAELGKQDIDGDIDLCTSRGKITPLAFNQAYEVKQESQINGRAGIGRRFNRLDVTPYAPTVTPFAGALFPVDRDDSFYLVKVAFKDTNNNGILDSGDTVVPGGVDALAMEIDNKAPNPYAAAAVGFFGGMAVGYYVLPPITIPTPGGNGGGSDTDVTGDGFGNRNDEDLVE